MADVINVDKLLNMDLCIPPYQRPYKWSIQNVQELLNDITSAISEAEKYAEGFKYRIGTIILNENDNGFFEVVDGQQRIISLLLIKKYLDPEFKCSILDTEFDNKITQANIHNNYGFIREWFSLKASSRTPFLLSFANILEVVVVCVKKTSEAFQLFDSQNTRGKELDPHDLLKAYHLREMKKFPYEMEHAVTKWEAKSTKQIRELFDLYLYPIWNWSHRIKSKSFTAKEIDTYKGVSEGSSYTYAKRASKAMPYFQITEPFVAGNDFFEMVEHYLYLLKDLMTEIDKNEAFQSIKEILNYKSDSAGFKYTKNLFYCALLCYYDKFHNFDEMSVKKLFVWTFMLRADMENLGFDTINKYAVGDDNTRYTNNIAMFSKISFARQHTEISSLHIKVHRNPDKAASENWDGLYIRLKEIIGVVEASNA